MSFSLENINIVEASSGVAAPMCGRLFADLGANVIWNLATNSLMAVSLVIAIVWI